MEIVWSVLLVALGLLAWAGQGLSRFAPVTAEKLSLTEGEENVEPVFWADGQGEALWDLLTLWTLVVAGVLLFLDHEAWAFFGLVAGGIYVYFAGRGILTRLEMQRRGFRIGDPGSVRLGLIMLAVWGVVGLITIITAVIDLSGS
jgi:hypothetical protein